MKRMLIAGNWKMNTKIEEAIDLAVGIRSGIWSRKLNSEVLVCPPFVNISQVIDALKGSLIQIGGQNCHFETKGAFTGEVSAPMLKSIGCKYVIIGHSERRQYFNEDDAIFNKKINSALNAGLTPIFCIGETLEQRNNGLTFELLDKQLNIALKDFDLELISNVVIAYEPVWAIGTGVAATNQQVEEAHDWLRDYFTNNYSDIGKNTILLYGGSLNDANADEILSNKNVNGGLIGGASLKIDSFMNIINTAEEILSR